MKRLSFHFLLFVIVLILLPEAVSAQQRHERDSLRAANDSLLNLIRVKDSLLLQSVLDSLYWNNIMNSLDVENDSLQLELRTMILADKLDSARQYSIDSINREFNRYSRWGLRDSLYNIDEDSVRRSLDNLLGVVFHDSAFSPDPDRLRQKMSRLFSHLSNDSVNLYFINSQNDTIPFVLKKNRNDSTAMFIVNAKNDSVKIYIYGRDKYSLYLEADDSFRLSEMLNKNVPPDILKRDWANLDHVKFPKRKVLAARPKSWTTAGNINLQLNQMSVSHWARGGNNQVTLIATSTGYANFKKGKISWNNDYSYRYGVIKSEGTKLNKNVEQLILKNSYHHKAYKNYHYSITSDFRSQIFPGYRLPNDSIPVSKFMAPAVYNIGLGMVYKPGKGLEITGNPISGQFTFVLDTALIDQRKYGVPIDKRVKNEIGTTIFIKYKKVLLQDINLSTWVKVFRSYVNSPKPDIDWRTDISLKINKYLQTKFYLYLKYDDDVLLPDYEYIDGVRTKIGNGKFLQVQQTFGITFNFYL